MAEHGHRTAARYRFPDTPLWEAGCTPLDAVVVAIALFAALIRFQVSSWRQAAALLPEDK